MVWQYTNHDRKLCERFKLQLQEPEEGQIPGCAGTTYGGPVGQTSGSKGWVPIEFQFPPKVLSDNRKGNWEKGELRGAEPIAVFATSGPREISLAWTYVVDSYDNNINSWSIGRITRNVRMLRGYFALVRDPGSARKNLTVKLQMWCIGGEKTISARIESINVKYGESLVLPPGGKSFQAFPLRTDITVDLRLWTKTGAFKETEDKKFEQNAPGMSPILTPDWY